MKAVLCARKDGVRLMTKKEKYFYWFLCPDKNVNVGDFVLVEYKIQKKNRETKKKISNRFFAVEKVVRVVENIQYDKLFLEKRNIMNFVVCKLSGDWDEISKEITKKRHELIEFYKGNNPFNEDWRIARVKHKLNIRWDVDKPNKTYNFVSLIPDLKPGDYVIVEYRRCYPKISTERKQFKEGEIAEVNHFSVARVEEMVVPDEMIMRDTCPIAFVVQKLPVASFDKRINQIKDFKKLYYSRYRHEEPYAKRKKTKKASHYWQKRKKRRDTITSWSLDEKKQS